MRQRSLKALNEEGQNSPTYPCPTGKLVLKMYKYPPRSEHPDLSFLINFGLNLNLNLSLSLSQSNSHHPQ
jgi:hypothetical protein